MRRSHVLTGFIERGGKWHRIGSIRATREIRVAGIGDIDLVTAGNTPPLFCPDQDKTFFLARVYRGMAFYKEKN